MEYAVHMEETGKMTHNHIGRAAASVGSESATFLRPSVPPSSRNDYDTDTNSLSTAWLSYFHSKISPPLL